MGILNKNNDPELINIEDLLESELFYNDFFFDDSESNEEKDLKTENKSSHQNKKNLKKTVRYLERQNFIHLPDGLHFHKNLGAKKLRRIENARFLLNFTDPNDICYDGSDLISKTKNVFSRLINNEENMKIWNEFVDLDEQSQNLILNDINNFNKKCDFIKDSINFLTNSKQCAYYDCSKFSFSAHKCFNNLSKKFRNSFKKNQNLPMQFMQETEEKLRSFFYNFSDVYVQTLKSKMERFYFHSITQYLFLTSKSLPDNNEPYKIIEVTNKLPYFKPPPTFLISYILERKNKSNNLQLL